MYNCKDIISHSVLSLYEGELLGVVDKLFFDKKLKKVVELQLIGEDGVKLSLPTKNIYHIGKNAITVRNNQCVEINTETTKLIAAPINSKAYSIQGEFLGVIGKISFNEKFITTEIELENNTKLNPKFIASCSKNTMIFYNKEDKIDVNRFTPNKNKKVLREKSVDIKETKQEQENLLSTEQKTENSIIEEQKHSLSTDFLIGRICTKDIFNFNNEILIKAHTIINKKNLKDLIKFGKVRELMLFSK